MRTAYLTLKWSRSSVCPLVVKGGSIWTQHQKHTFQNEFCVGSLVKYSKIIKTQQKNRKSDVGFQNGGQLTI